MDPGLGTEGTLDISEDDQVFLVPGVRKRCGKGEGLDFPRFLGEIVAGDSGQGQAGDPVMYIIVLIWFTDKMLETHDAVFQDVNL